MVVAAPRSEAPPTFQFDYDSAMDVLYVQWGNEPAVVGDEFAPNAIVRLTTSGRPAGVTVYDVRRVFRFDPLGDLATQASAIAVAVLSSYLSTSHP